MPNRRLRSVCSLAGLLAVGACLAGIDRAMAQPESHTPQPWRFTLSDGDRVVLLGSTFIEREQSHGYLEAALASRFHDANVQFRNLGWSGDNVFGEARAGFGAVEQGFEELKGHVASLEPTLIFVNYGANEAFAGKEGLERFREGLDRLLKTLDETGARIVLIAPPAHEDLGRPLPDPAEQNRNLKLYGEVIAKLASQRGDPLIDLFDALGKRLDPPAGGPLTDNGMHLTAYGYWCAAQAIERALELPQRDWLVEIDAPRGNIVARGTLVGRSRFSADEIRFHARDRQLPLPPPPADAPREGLAIGSPRVLRVFDLPDGTFTLNVDGQPVATATSRGWANGVTLAAGAPFDQAEQLRQTILAKNELYFHRWRPQNVTYLFGFRKHEQGQNAIEIPQFDPLVEAREAAIRTLCVPIDHEYQLVRVHEE